MPFPDEAIDVRVELDLGGWTDITPHVYTRDPITITGGRTSEGSQADPSKCTMTLNNRDGRYSPRNPNSPYYGMLGRNTPLRVTVPGDHSTLTIPGGDADRAVAVGSETANITGDIEVRVELSDAQWSRTGVILSKRSSVGDQRSWMLGVEEGTGNLLFIFYDLGTAASQRYRVSSVAPSAAEGRQAVRVTVNAAATIFYTGPSIEGPWTQLGDTRSGRTTPIYASTAPIILGAEPTFGNVTFAATYHAWRALDGVGGTPVIDVNLDDLAVEGPSFVDGLGRTWSVEGGAELASRLTRFAGEVPGWPVKWGPSGQDVHVTIEAAGITRRLGQGAKPVASALRRSIAGSDRFTAWWPLEDSPGAQRAASGYLDRPPMRAAGEVNFTGEPVEGLGGGVEIGTTGNLGGPVLGGTATTWVVAWWMNLPAVTGTEDAFTNSVVLHWLCPGSPGAWQWLGYARANPATGAQEFTLQSTDEAGGATTFIQYSGPLWGIGPVQFVLHATQSGAGVQGALWVDGVLASADTTFAGDFLTPVASMGLNNISIVSGSGETEFAGMVSHVLIADGNRVDEVLDLVPAGRGYAGETAGTRVTRLAIEENIPLTLSGDAADSVAMGPQLPATILELLNEAAEADGGLLIDRRDALALHYRTRAADYNAEPALTLDYHDQVAHPLEPVDDDQHVRNDYTVERRGGSSARAVKEEGALSTLPPPDGVGVYDEAVTLNLADDSQLAAQAGWRMHLGTVDEARYPIVRLKLHKHPELIPAATAITERSVIRLTGLPAWLPPDDVDLIVDGYTEVIESLRWTMEWNTVPASPYRVGITDDPVYGRADTDGCRLDAAVDADDTTLIVESTAGPLWTSDPAEFPFDLAMGGEILTATAASPAGSAVLDNFAVTVASGWGTADTGQAWSVATGSAADFSAAAGTGGVISSSTTNAERGIVLNAGSPHQSVLVHSNTPVIPTGAPVTWGFYLRYADASNYYWVGVEIGTSSTLTLRVRKRVAGTLTTIASAVSATAHATFPWRILRAEVVGPAIRAKVWPADAAEPDGWEIETTDTALAAGNSAGCVVRRETGSTNGTSTAFDIFTVTQGFQALTVARSVNGVAKGHAAGADIRLAQPMIIAL